MKLYKIPKESKILVDTCSDGSTYIMFHHIDGQHSYCTTEKGNTAHLPASSEVEELGGGEYELLD